MTITNHWGVWVDSEKPTIGVYSNNSIAWEWINDDICLVCEKWINEIENNPLLSEDEKQDALDSLECDSSHEKIMGDWIKDEQGLYMPDITGEFSAIIREDVTQVVWSKTTEKHGLCSPCYPGQCDIDSEGDFLAYTLPDYLIYTDKE